MGYDSPMKTRHLQPRLEKLSSQYPVIFLTGPRQSGKTTLARFAFPDFKYISLEDLQNRREAQEDPRGFLARLDGLPGVILDEVQGAPELFSYIQVFVDEARCGPVIMTGSQNFLLSQQISQSLAGRTAILELLPFSLAELLEQPALTPEDFEAGKLTMRQPPAVALEDILFQGLFPPIHDRGLEPATWLDGYVRTYVERDVRNLANIGNLETFTRFLGLCAGRAGQLLNSSSLGSDTGVDHTTARRWLSILQASYVVDLVKPHFQNFSKRLVKSPKIFFLDTGLMCHLLNIRKAEDLHIHPLRGAIFENFVYSELKKLYTNHGPHNPLYFWRDTHGREVDFLIDLGGRQIPVEVKAGKTIAGDFFKGLDNYVKLSGGPQGILVYSGNDSYKFREHLVRAWWTCT